MKKHKLYRDFVKTGIDRILAGVALVVLSPIMLIVAVLIRIKLGSPILFKQERAGKNGQRFMMYKFRSMSDERDSDGKLLPDEIRLGSFGRKLRATSLEGNDIIRQTTKSLENKGFCEVSPIPFFNGCNLISNDFRVMIA